MKTSLPSTPWTMRPGVHLDYVVVDAPSHLHPHIALVLDPQYAPLIVNAPVLLSVLESIVQETCGDGPEPPRSAASYLPDAFLAAAMAVIDACRCPPGEHA